MGGRFPLCASAQLDLHVRRAARACGLAHILGLLDPFVPRLDRIANVLLRHEEPEVRLLQQRVAALEFRNLLRRALPAAEPSPPPSPDDSDDASGSDGMCSECESADEDEGMSDSGLTETGAPAA